MNLLQLVNVLPTFVSRVIVQPTSDQVHEEQSISHATFSQVHWLRRLSFPSLKTPTLGLRRC